MSDRVYTDTERMELRAEVRLAGNHVSPYWPIRTFVNYNPLHALEHLDFEEAVEAGRRWLRGRGYLTNEFYREYCRRGRIKMEDVDSALHALAKGAWVEMGTRRLRHEEVLRAHLLHEISTPPRAVLQGQIEQPSADSLLETIAERLQAIMPHRPQSEPIRRAVDEDLNALGRRMTLSHWCDQVLGTTLVAEIDTELLHWCAAFLDEGQAVWAMPHRELGFYGAWKQLVLHDVGGLLSRVANWRAMVTALPDYPEDAILESLAVLELPKECWRDYFSLHLVTLPGWVAFIKWRGDQHGYDWQEAYPASLVKYLAVRLFYERMLVEHTCEGNLKIRGTLTAVQQHIAREPVVYFLERERLAGGLSPWEARRVDRLRYGRKGADQAAWAAIAEEYLRRSSSEEALLAVRGNAWRVIMLAKHFAIAPAELLAARASDLKMVLDWLDEFPEDRHGPVWLQALEAGYRERLVGHLRPRLQLSVTPPPYEGPEVRADAQAVFCIDVRSEVFRRHLEAVGNYETLGFAGFFICFIRYQAFGSEYQTDQFPVIMKAKQLVREIPRSYQGQALQRYRTGLGVVRAVHGLLHDLKEHVITPYVMVESLGWFYLVPFLAKTLIPVWYRTATRRIKQLVAPTVSTTLTIDKLSKSEAEEMVASEQRAAIRLALRERFGRHGALASPQLVEALRLQALDADNGTAVVNLAEGLRLSQEEAATFLETLRREYRMDLRWAAAQKERITQTGLTLEEQVFTVETALRMMGLTGNFARLVLFCAHGSTSENNPFEASLDCGACGGNEGRPNARLLAAMANKPAVRERIGKDGIEIPADTHFIAGQINTTTDEVELLDLEDVPSTHRKDLTRLIDDLKEASAAASRERCASFPDVRRPLPASRAQRHVQRRSADWSQVRPEWGLAGNAAFIIGRRCLTKGLSLEGRVFLHSYDYRQDPGTRLLEIILTAPQVVTQWINMSYYFSTVDNEVYGSGSKIYHNVVGRVGVMLGTQSDLRTGLPEQTVMDGERPYHEPVRLLTVVEAPRAGIEKLIRRHEMLQRFYDNQWIHLLVLEPEEQVVYRYLPKQGWGPVSG